MKKKSTDLFGGFTLNDIIEKLFSSKKLQPVLDRTVEQMMRVKSGLDTIMPMALGAFNLPSAEDIRRLNNEVAKLDSKLEMLSKLLTGKKKVKRRKPAKKAKPSAPVSHEETKKETVSPGTEDSR
jgi:hypothetical protein